MPFSAWRADLPLPVGLAIAGALVALGLWVMWAARHRAENERTRLPLVGLVGAPTCLTLGLCSFGVAYHALAYALPDSHAIPSLPRDGWWILLAICTVAIAGSIASDWLERRADSPG